MSNPKKDGNNAGRRIFCGVDVGASATKVVLIDDGGEVLARQALKSGVDYQASSEACYEKAKAELGPQKVNLLHCVSTGYGRNNVDFANDAVTEITCHGRGCYHHFPRNIVIVDIGGQDSKVIELDKDGRRLDFKMNRKCAAGTGAFLEEIAARLELELSDLDHLARNADKEFTLGSFCTVFAKTEILAYIRKGERIENIIRGAFQSVVNRIVEMGRFDGEVVLTGGVVQYNPYLADALAKKLGTKVLIPPHPQFTGALGAALTAKETANTR